MTNINSSGTRIVMFFIQQIYNLLRVFVKNASQRFNPPNVYYTYDSDRSVGGARKFSSYGRNRRRGCLKTGRFEVGDEPGRADRRRGAFESLLR